MRTLFLTKFVLSFLSLCLIAAALSGCVKKISLEIVNQTHQEMSIDWVAVPGSTRYPIGIAYPDKTTKFETALPSRRDYELLFYDKKTGKVITKLDADGRLVDSRLKDNTWTVTISVNNKMLW